MVEDPRQGNSSSESRESNPTPITSSLRTIARHLHASAGPWFWLRGTLFFLSYRMATSGNLISFLPNLDDRSWLIQTLAALLIGALFTNWQVTWIHAVISQPSTKSSLERLLRFRCSGAVMSVLSMQMTLHHTALKYSRHLQSALLQHFSIRYNPRSSSQIFALALFPNTVQYLVSVAVRVLFVRIAASTLPADEPPIVPLDPSLHNNHGLGIGGVWSTLSSPALARALRILKRQFAITMAISILGEMIKPGFHKDIEFPLIWFY